jgi:hypothetical protein
MVSGLGVGVGVGVGLGFGFGFGVVGVVASSTRAFAGISTV